MNQLADPNVNLIRAKNGNEAWQICESQKDIDIVLMDIKMPEMNGYLATEKIKQLFPQIPVIAQSAFITEKVKAISYGCDDFLSKPFKKEEILFKIHKHLKIKS